MLRIAVLNKISRDILNGQFNQYQEVSLEEHPDLVFVRSHDLNKTDLPKSIIAIGRAGTGVNNIPIEQCNQKGIAVFNAPGANANAVKELVLFGLLAAARPAIAATMMIRAASETIDAESVKSHFVGSELAGKTIFVIGLGKIGMEVAEMCVALGMRVIGHDPFVRSENIRDSRIHVAMNVKQGLEVADYVTLHSALTPESTGMVNSEFLNQMKRGVKLLNFARGEMIDTVTVRHALQNQHLAKYVSDFYDRMFASEAVSGQAIFFPHLGASTEEAETNAATMVAKQLDDFFRFGYVKNSVNFPEINFLVPAGKSQNRILVHHKDSPGILTQITGIAAGLGYNIAGSLNKSNKNRSHAVTILDLDFSGKPPVLMEVTFGIEKLEGVTSARICDLNF
ncbi:MAG: D-3-phosphoglycerate dehydrogenase [Parcubacteria group bacterium Gr01-1014_3]|nr:MAG: D-3-phosphoglycerate dehydrogenase [Parcubacteria group bacterium Gr01-1014_3]